MSVAEMAIIPVQDLLGLTAYAHMNIPGNRNNNWGWRMTSDELTEEIRKHLKMVTCIYGRSGKDPG
jgi:4-alpha-glucanotransferase